MAARDLTDIEDKSEIIRAIENSSSKQLRELIEIKRILSKQDPKSSGMTITRRADQRSAANDSGYTPNSLGLRLKINGKSVKLDQQGNIKMNVRPESPVISENVEKKLPPAKRERIKAGRNKSTDSDSSEDGQVIKKEGKRDSKGRFVSDKTNQATKERMERERERKRNIKDQEGFWGKFGDEIRESLEDKANSGEVTDIAGKAAGGVFWSAGKEFYDVAANASKSIYQFSKKFQSDAANDDEPVAAKPVTSQPDNLISSAQQLQDKRSADESRDEKKTRDETLKENERQTEILEELLDDSKKAGAGGSLLGGLASSLGDFFTGGRKGGKGRAGRPGKAPKAPSKPGRFGKLGRMLKIGTAATVVGAGGAVAYDAVSDKKPATKPPAQPTAKEKAATNNAASQVEKKAAASAVTKTAEKSILSSAAKGIGTAAKGAVSALASLPGLGAAISGGLGYIDEEGQNRAFGEGNVGTQQKSSYAATSILDFGGLTSMGFNALADGAEWAGLSEDMANNLRIDPAIAAKQLDGIVTSVGDSLSAGFTSAMDFFSGNDSQKAQQENLKAKDPDKASSKEVADAVQEGTNETVGAIKDLTKQITKEGGVYGQDNIAVPEGGSLGAAVTQDMISSDLNIGGANAKVRSFRNNNFGNLNFVGQAGATLEDKNANGEARFAKFATPEEGFRGLANQLSLYADGKSKAAGGKKINTVEDIISLYAPSTENNTQSYIDNLSKSLGVGRKDALDLSNPEIVTKMMRGIATIEGGNPQVTDDFIKKAIGQKDANGKWRGEFSDQSLTAINAKRAEKGLAPISKTDQYSNPESIKNKPVQKATETSAVAPAVTAAATVAATAVADQVSKVEGLRDPASIKANEKAAPAKAAATTTATSTAPNDKAGFMAWAANLADGAAMFGDEQLNQIEGLRDVKDTSGMMLPASMTKTGGSIGGRNVEAYDYGEPIGKDGKPLPKTEAISKASEPDKDGWRTDANGVKFRYTDEKKKTSENEPSFLSKVADTVVPSLADAFQTTIGGIDIRSMGGQALEAAGIDRGVQSRLSPISDKLYGYGNQTVKDISQAGGDMIRSVQPVQESRRNLNTVTDLAGSGVRSESDRARESNIVLVDELKKLNTTMTKILTETKGNKVADPSTITKTPQPQPRQNDIPLQGLSGALANFLGE